jgi:hypothetical protein
MLKTAPADNYIKVCEKKCVYDAVASKAGDVKCTLPGVATTYSNANFGIEKPTDALNSGVYFGSMSSSN